MAIARGLFVVLLSVALPLLFLCLASEGSEVGVNYGRVAKDLPDPALVSKLLKDNGITMVKIYDANSTVLRSLANTGIKVMVMVPNENVAGAASNPSFAHGWVRDNVAAYLPATRINGVAVGNEVFASRPDLNSQLVPAMRNVQAALEQLGLAGAVKVSTPIAFSAVADSFPPSSGRFRDELVPVMTSMLQFLQQTGSELTMNIYPYFAYVADPGNIPLEYALGNYPPGVQDPATGLVYHSLLDSQLDATYYATEKLGFYAASLPGTDLMAQDNDNKAVKSGLGETAHPTGGQSRHGGRRLAAADGSDAATVANAQAYTNYLINRVLSGMTGTPHRPDAGLDVYIFELFNEDNKGSGPDDVEQNFGLFYPNMTRVYEFDFVNGELVRGEPGRRGRAAAGGAGLRVRPRRGLQRHPAPRFVLRSRHQARARLLRSQQLLPKQEPLRRRVRLQRRSLHRLPEARRHVRDKANELVRGERGGRGCPAEDGAGLRLRQRRRLQRHPARRLVLPAQHHGGARLVRVQQLLPEQGPGQRDLRLQWRWLRRQPATSQHLRRDGDDLVRGELGRRRCAAADGAGLRLQQRRGLQRHSSRRSLLRPQHESCPCLVRVQQLLPAQEPCPGDVRLLRRRLHRQPGTEVWQLRAPIEWLNRRNSREFRRQLPWQYITSGF